MQPLNAIDALAPAFTRTHEVLFKPFKTGRTWKLAMSQYLGWCGSMFLPMPLFVLLIPVGTPGRAATAVIMSVFTLVHLVILYFCARMELVAFEMVVTRAKFVAPMWRRYGARVWPWLGAKIVLGTVFAALVAALFVGPIRHMIVGFAGLMPDIAGMQHGAQPDPVAMQQMMAPMMARIFGLEALLCGIVFVLKIPSTLLNDFVLPFYVLEDVTLTAAIGRGFRVFQADPVQVILYLILKPILFVIGYITQTIVLEIAMIPIFIVVAILGVIAGLLGMPIHHIGAGGGLLLVAGAVVLGVAVFVAIGYLTTLAIGYLLTLLEAYGIYFLGGRYALLGSMLEPGPGGPFTPPPVFPSAEEQKDDDGGPPMPMNPAVA